MSDADASSTQVDAARISEYRALVLEKLEPLELSRAAEVSRADAELSEWSDLRAQLQGFARHLASQGAPAVAASVPASTSAVSLLPSVSAVPASRCPLKLHADIGEGFHMHARIACEALESEIAINIGAGVFLPMRLPDAVGFVDRKLALLESTRDAAQEQLDNVRTDLSMARTALAALANL